MSDIDDYFLLKEEPVKSCLMALRAHILGFDKHMTEEWKYKMPFYCYNGKMFCYLWVNRKSGQPYIGIVEGRNIKHPDLVMEKRSRMKILPIDMDNDIPVKKIDGILKMAIKLYK